MAHTTTWARAAITAAAISCCGVMTAATAAADFDLSHHPAPALAPGVGIGIYNAGGPVYYRNADGTATPVGITIRAADADGGTVAELIGPWLKRWSLRVDSS